MSQSYLLLRTNLPLYREIVSPFKLEIVIDTRQTMKKLEIYTQVDLKKS